MRPQHYQVFSSWTQTGLGVVKTSPALTPVLFERAQSSAAFIVGVIKNAKFRAIVNALQSREIDTVPHNTGKTLLTPGVRKTWIGCVYSAVQSQRRAVCLHERHQKPFRDLLHLPAAASPSSSFHVRAGPKMAKSKFEYARQFEADDPCLPNCWLVVRIDGKAFHKFTDTHHYMKPNDERGLSLMTRAAQTVMSEFNEIVLSYGQSDEYSFVFHKNCKLYNRRASKIMTNVVSLFASSFTLYWPRFFNSQDLQYPPSFDGRVVLYPSDENLRDYLSWRQADCHINNLYNTCFWKLVQDKGLTPNRAADRLKGTLSSDKNELLFSEFSINYNNLPELFRKGSVLIRPKGTDGESLSSERSINNHSRGHEGKASKKPGSIVLHTDIIGKQFWEDNPHILNSKI